MAKKFTLPDADPVLEDPNAEPRIRLGCSFQLEIPLSAAVMALDVYIKSNFPKGGLAQAAAFASWVKKNGIHAKQEKGAWDALYDKFTTSKVGG